MAAGKKVIKSPEDEGEQKAASITNQVLPEELQAKIDALEGMEEEDKPVTPAKEGEEEIIDPVKDEKELDDEELDENGEPIKPATPKTPEAPKPPEKPIDYEARYKGSTQEAQILEAKNKQFATAVEEADKLPAPTEEELKTEYGPDNWELMDEVQKKLAVDNLTNKRRFEKINSAVAATKKVDEWVSKVKEFAENPETSIKYPVLDGKEADFIRFCTLPSRVGVNLEDLIKAFAFDTKPSAPKKKTILESGGGGEGLKPKPTELTTEEVTYLRTNDQRKYKELLKAGKINLDI